MSQRVHRILASGLSLLLALWLAGCTASSTVTVLIAVTPTPSPTSSPTPLPTCVRLVPGMQPFTGISAVSGLMLPAGAYISSAVHSGGGAGQYLVATYTVCFHGGEAAIDGFSGSTLAQLKASGWKLNNLFPDPSNHAYLDYCSNSHNCVNTSSASSPFTFVSFDQYGSHGGGYTTFRLQVATISAPSCLNDPQYYSGTPKYTIFYDGNSASPSGVPQNHFQMPPGTRVSTFQGGGTAGSTYVYYCSAGTQASVAAFLKQAMSNAGWAISGASASGFTATFGSNPTYTIAVNVQNPNNYYLRVYIPM